MRKGTIITTSIIGGVLASTLVAGGSFALAADNDDSPPSPQSQRNSQSTHGSDHDGNKGSESPGRGQGMQNGQGPSAEKMDGLDGIASGTLTSEQEATLSYMAEEEKMAHDLYIAFGELYGDKVFDQVARAESKHLSAVQTLLERYNLSDPTAGQDVGTFTTESVQKLYDAFLAQGSVSRDGAFEAARTIEKDDISSISAASKGLTAPDVTKVYGQLLSASEHHLAAFSR